MPCRLTLPQYQPAGSARRDRPSRGQATQSCQEISEQVMEPARILAMAPEGHLAPLFTKRKPELVQIGRSFIRTPKIASYPFRALSCASSDDSAAGCVIRRGRMIQDRQRGHSPQLVVSP